MIEITRALARRLRAVLRKAVPVGSGRGTRPPLLLQAARDGLRVRALHPDVAVEFHLPGTRPTDVLTLPAEALDDCEGRREEVVTLEKVGADTVQGRWHDAGVPQVRDYPAADPQKLPPIPEEPRQLLPSESGLLRALADAARTVARQNGRFALQKVQLRGSTGEVVATDGKQLLLQGGFTLPWPDDPLVPALGVFACKELAREAGVALGRTDGHVCVRAGAWTFFLAIDPEGRFPDAGAVIPAATASATTCRLTGEDAAFLAQALPRLPGRDDDQAPLTLDLNGHVAVRARGEGQGRPTEVILARSTVAGPPVRLVSDRQYLARAVGLGFTEVRVTRPDLPVVCTDRERTYLWMPLGKDGALPPTDDALRIIAAGAAPATPPRKQERRTHVMSRQPPASEEGNDPARRHGEESHATNGSGTGLGALLAEAQALREELHEAHGRAARLVLALKRQQKQARLTATALASLRQLQELHPLDG